MSNYARAEMPAVYSYTEFTNYKFLRQHRTIPATGGAHLCSIQYYLRF